MVHRDEKLPLVDPEEVAVATATFDYMSDMGDDVPHHSRRQQVVELLIVGNRGDYEEAALVPFDDFPGLVDERQPVGKPRLPVNQLLRTLHGEKEHHDAERMDEADEPDGGKPCLDERGKQKDGQVDEQQRQLVGVVQVLPVSDDQVPSIDIIAKKDKAYRAEAPKQGTGKQARKKRKGGDEADGEGNGPDKELPFPEPDAKQFPHIQHMQQCRATKQEDGADMEAFVTGPHASRQGGIGQIADEGKHDDKAVACQYLAGLPKGRRA